MPSEHALNHYASADEGRTSTYQDICTKSSCRCRPDTQDPCPIYRNRLSKETEICYKCEVRTGGNPHLTKDQVSILYEQAVEIIKHQDEAPEEITVKHHKCAMPWCRRMTKRIYCDKCGVMVSKRKALGWPAERLHEPKHAFVKKKCAMPWCDNRTAGSYCEPCYNMILSRQRHGWPESRWYEQPKKGKRAEELKGWHQI